MEIRKIPIEKLNAAEYNPRRDLQPGDAEYDSLQRSIETFGYAEPIIWNERTGNIVGGHQRFKILQAQGLTEIEVSVVNLTDEQEKAFNIALNKIGGDWDNEKLKALLSELSNSESVDVALTGFDSFELDALFADYNENEDLSDFFAEKEEKPKQPKMTTCPFCGKQHEV